MQIPWLQNISPLLAPVAVPPMTGTFMVVFCFLGSSAAEQACSVQQRDESLSGCMSQVGVGN